MFLLLRASNSLNPALPIKGLNFHSDKTKTWRRQTCLTCVRTVDIGRMCLAIRTQNQGEVGISGFEMFLCLIFF